MLKPFTDALTPCVRILLTVTARRVTNRLSSWSAVWSAAWSAVLSAKTVGSLLSLQGWLQDRFDNFSGMHLLEAFMPIIQAPATPNDWLDIKLTVGE